MESPDLKPHSPDDAQLETWLRDNAATPPLPDDGFSNRVLAALAPDAQDVTHRIIICLVGAAAGMGFAVAQGLSWSDIFAGDRLNPALTQGLAALAQPSILLALAITAASLVFAFWRGTRLDSAR